MAREEKETEIGTARPTSQLAFMLNRMMISIRWDDATPYDWKRIERMFIACFMNAYVNKPFSEVAIDSVHVAEAERTIATSTTKSEYQKILKRLHFYALSEAETTDKKHVADRSLPKTLLHRALLEMTNIFENPESSADILATQKQKLTQLFAMYLAFKHYFENEQAQIFSSKTDHPQKIHYVLARGPDESPLAFISTECNPKSARAYLRWVMVSPVAQNVGLGSYLLHVILNHYHDCRGVELYTRRINEKAIAFYLRNGLQIIPLALPGELEFVRGEDGRPKITNSSKLLITKWLTSDKVYPPAEDSTEHLADYTALATAKSDRAKFI